MGPSSATTQRCVYLSHTVSHESAYRSYLRGLCLPRSAKGTASSWGRQLPWTPWHTYIAQDAIRSRLTPSADDNIASCLGQGRVCVWHVAVAAEGEAGRKEGRENLGAPRAWVPLGAFTLPVGAGSSIRVLHMSQRIARIHSYVLPLSFNARKPPVRGRGGSTMTN
mgnify:CR=1 FL=1